MLLTKSVSHDVHVLLAPLLLLQLRVPSFAVPWPSYYYAKHHSDPGATFCIVLVICRSRHVARSGNTDSVKQFGSI